MWNSVDQAAHEEPPGAPVVKRFFPHETAVQALIVHRPWSCLPVLLIIHHLWLPSQLLVGCVWFGDSYLQSPRSGCSCFNEQHVVLVPGQGGGPEHPRRDLKWSYVSSYVPLPTSHCYWISASHLPPALTTGSHSQLPETTGEMSAGAGMNPAAPSIQGLQP